MKYIVAVLAGLSLIFSLKVSAHPITLEAGESFHYQFDSLPFHGVSEHYSGAVPQGLLFWDAQPLVKNTLLEVKMFENSVNEDPLHSWTWTNPVIGGGIILSGPSFPEVWQDLQGAFSITAVTGSAVINSIELKSIIPHHIGGIAADVYGYSNLLKVPEPSLGMMFVMMIVVFMLKTRRR